MTPNDYIEKTKRALATEQPNLAMLYMARGIAELDAREVNHVIHMFALALQHMASTCDRVAIGIREVLDEALVTIHHLRELNRASH